MPDGRKDSSMLSNSEPFVRTVLGDISPEELGHTQCHEHIYLEKGASFACDPALCIDDFAKSLLELRDYALAGGGTIVDAQPGGCGRNASALAKLSRASGVHIVAVTGFHRRQFFDWDSGLDDANEERLAERFYKELTDGMTDHGVRTPCRAGVVKTALEPGGLQDARYGGLFAAAARAAAGAGAPVMVHTQPDTDLFELIRFFEPFGVPPQRLLLCHLDRTHIDAGYHRELLQAGCRLCYDSINRPKYLSQEQEISLIRAAAKAGYAHQIVLSLDTTNRRLRAYGSKEMGLDYILTAFLPLLRRAGICEEDLELMCRKNAQSILQIHIKSGANK